MLRVTNGQSTVYAWGVWELTVGGQSRKLYQFNGQSVAIREHEANRVTYLHSDHLGSASVATDQSGNLASRQDYGPWGTIRSGDIPQTTLDYTGQRRDDTGLLFYNARYYDPAVGRFVSADTIAPVREQPQSRNRYSYVLNNPLKFTDPSGHCNEASNDGDDGDMCRIRLLTLDQYRITMEDYDTGVWSLAELDLFYEAVRLLQYAAGWSIKEFYNHIGDVHIRQSLEWTGWALDGNTDHPAVAWPKLVGQHSEIIFYQNALYASKQDMENGVLNTQFFKRTVVHELAHAWDYRSLVAQSGGLAFVRTYSLGYTTAYGKGSAAEDWAESVAEYVTGGQDVDNYRKAYVRQAMK